MLEGEMYRVCVRLPTSMSWARLCPGRPVRHPVPPVAWTARVGAVCLSLTIQFSSAPLTSGLGSSVARKVRTAFKIPKLNNFGP